MKALPGNFETIMPLKGPTPHGYFTHHPRGMVEEESYFLPVYNRLKRGDRIEVTYDLDTELVWVNYMVFEATRTSVKVAVINEFSAKLDPVKAPVPVPPPTREVFAQEGYRAEWGGPKHKWRVVDKEGNVIRKNLDKDEAFALAGGHKALEVA